MVKNSAANTRKTPTEIIAQIRKDVRAVMRGLFELKTRGELYLLPEDFRVDEFAEQAAALLSEARKRGRPMKIKNEFGIAAKKWEREDRQFTPEKADRLLQNKIEAEGWEAALSGNKLTVTKFSIALAWAQWVREQGRAPTAREVHSRKYQGAIKTTMTRLSEANTRKKATVKNIPK